MSGARGSNHDTLPPAQKVSERALEASRSEGCMVIVKDVYEANVRYANNSATTNGVKRDRRVTVISLVSVPGGYAVGTAGRSGGGQVGDLVTLSEADANGSPPASDAAPLVAGGSDSGFGEPPGETSLGVLRPVIDELGEVFKRARSEGTITAGFARHRVSTTYLASSTGLRLRHAQPDGKIELVARAADGSASSWAGQGTGDFLDVTLGELEKRVYEGLRWSKRRISLPAGRYDTVFRPDAVADLMVLASDACSGLGAEEGGNVYSAAGGGTRTGERLAELPFTLESGPNLPGLECAPFVAVPSSDADHSVFDNGLAIGSTGWIESGLLRRLRYSRAGASRSGVTPTPAVDNLRLSAPGATASLNDLVRRVDRGLLVTCLYYLHEVDPATLLFTGLTRDGVYLVDRGEVIGAVNNFRFNESPIDVLARTIEAGRTERALSREWSERLTRTAMPPLRVAEFNMSSVSTAT
jgi:predicted Zn-dependent protease